MGGSCGKREASTIKLTIVICRRRLRDTKRRVSSPAGTSSPTRQLAQSPEIQARSKVSIAEVLLWIISRLRSGPVGFRLPTTMHLWHMTLVVWNGEVRRVRKWCIVIVDGGGEKWSSFLFCVRFCFYLSWDSCFLFKSLSYL